MRKNIFLQPACNCNNERGNIRRKENCVTKAKSGALAALAKLKTEREALAKREAELTEAAARELGLLVLGSGLERFSPAGFKKVVMALGSLGESEALARLGQGAK
jgi:Family of unknown function (DUF6437)